MTSWAPSSPMICARRERNTDRVCAKDRTAETGRCIVLVTPDGERSMNTYLGVTEFLKPSDIIEAEMAQAEWIYLEGYRFDGPESHAAFAKAVRRPERRAEGFRSPCPIHFASSGTVTHFAR